MWFSQFVDDEPQIRSDWQLQHEIEEENTIMFNMDNFIYVIDNDSHRMYKINVNEDQVTSE